MANSQKSFVGVTIGRSDGVVYSFDDLTKSSRSTVRWSEPLPDDDQRVLRWKFTIGRALAAEMGWPKEKDYSVDFPQHYVLRTKDQKAKGNSDKLRADPFMVGHPAGCADKHCFRSPGEFVYHLLWLLSDSTDRTQCPCKVCTEVTDSGKKRERPVSVPVKTEATAPTTAPQKITPVPTPVPIPFPKPTPISAASPSPAPTPAPAPPKAATPTIAPQKASAIMPSPTPSAALSTTPATTQRDDTMFRQGEMVWFKAAAWRIGIIAMPSANNLNNNGSTVSRYLLAPLGHQALAQPNVVKGEEDMRPFLTFSVPQIAVEGLAGKTYGEIDWVAFAKNFKGNKEVVGLEASKMAALAIDGSYSVFNKMPTTDPAKQYYGGIFLGAENVHIGDAVRLKQVSGERLVMEVGKIFVDDTGPKFQGNLYRPLRIAAGEQAQYPPETQPQGPTFKQEMEFRNSVQSAVHNIFWVWQLVEKDALRKEQDVAGRYYVTPKLMKILDAKRFQDTLEAHVVEDVMSYLNNRMQNSGIKYLGRRPNRRTTVGAAVGTALAMGEGISEENY